MKKKLQLGEQKKNGTNEKFSALKVSNICQQMCQNNFGHYNSACQSFNLAFFFEAKLSHIKCVNEMTGKDVWTFLMVGIILCWGFCYVMRG